jgi:hypothetical protein
MIVEKEEQEIIEEDEDEEVDVIQSIVIQKVN